MSGCDGEYGRPQEASHLHTSMTATESNNFKMDRLDPWESAAAGMQYS